MEKLNATCLNCNHHLDGDFCSRCGQSAAIGKISFKEFGAQIFSVFFSLDGPLITTVSGLVRNPGKVFRGFISGQRVTYYKPVSFFVLVTAVYLIIRWLLDYDPLKGQFQNIDKEGVELAAFQMKSYKASRFMLKNINYILFLLAISIGLVSKLFFRKKYALAEFTAIGFYISSLYIGLGTVLMIISSVFDLYTAGYQLLVLGILIFVCLVSLFQKNTFWRWFKYAIASAVSVLLYMFLSFGLSFLLVN